MHLPQFSFTVLDTETTGFVPRVHKVIEFASIHCEGGKEVHTEDQLLSISGEIPPHVQVLTHIKPADISGKPSMDDVRERIRESIGSDTVIVGHNIMFDIGMMKGEGIDLTEQPHIDTSLLAALVFPELRSFSLPYLSTVLNLNHTPHHRALGDVRATLELFAACIERLQKLPQKRIDEVKEIFQKAPKGWQMLFEEIKGIEGIKGIDEWITHRTKHVGITSKPPCNLSTPDVGSVSLVEESLDPGFLQELLACAAKDTKTTHWVAVKNLDAALHKLDLPKNCTILYPPQHILNSNAAEKLLAQEQFTEDEATLAAKIRWFKPMHRADLALHGGERDVWNGVLAATEESEVYRAQFTTDANVRLIDHKQLLTFLQHEKSLIEPGSHVIIDDASMLEDTATKAYGHYVSLDDLRAAAQGDKDLTSFTDAVFLFCERARQNEDLHFFTPGMLSSVDAKTLRERLAPLQERTDFSERTMFQLKELAAVFDPKILGLQMVWIEHRINGSLSIIAAPEHVDMLLKTYLYDRFATTLLVPQGSTTLAEVLPDGVSTTVETLDEKDDCKIRVNFPREGVLRDVLKNPPEGRTIILAGSKRIIEQMFIEFSYTLEKVGIALICQGLSGGQNRMEAEFIAAEKAVWLLTPWTYEGVELPEDTVSHLFIDTLPFDHPSQPVLNRRKNHFQDGFNQYYLPRLEHRLFRLLRTFCKHRTKESDVSLYDKRLFEKDYGRGIQKFFAHLAGDKAAEKKAGEGEQLKLL